VGSALFYTEETQKAQRREDAERWGKKRGMRANGEDEERGAEAGKIDLI